MPASKGNRPAGAHAEGLARLRRRSARLRRKARAHGLPDRIGMTVAEAHEKKFRRLCGEFARLRALMAAHYQPTTVNLDWI